MKIVLMLIMIASHGGASTTSHYVPARECFNIKDNIEGKSEVLGKWRSGEVYITVKCIPSIKEKNNDT